MNIIYDSKYKKENTKFICLHHCGGLASNPFWSSQHQTVHDIDVAHRSRWPNFISELGFWCGYNFVITADGAITQTRKVGEETAAAKGYNQNGEVISICLAGNFTKGVDTPTKEQENSLRELYKQLPQVAPYNIVSHRALTGLTECYGSGLKDDWARNILLDNKTQISIMMQMLSKMIDILRKMQRPLGKLKGYETVDRG